MDGVIIFYLNILGDVRRRAEYSKIEFQGRDENQDICILSLGIKQESRIIISECHLWVKHQHLY